MNRANKNLSPTRAVHSVYSSLFVPNFDTSLSSGKFFRFLTGTLYYAHFRDRLQPSKRTSLRASRLREPLPFSWVFRDLEIHPKRLSAAGCKQWHNVSK